MDIEVYSVEGVGVFDTVGIGPIVGVNAANGVSVGDRVEAVGVCIKGVGVGVAAITAKIGEYGDEPIAT